MRVLPSLGPSVQTDIWELVSYVVKICWFIIESIK
jgi:hypothetical protein